MFYLVKWRIDSWLLTLIQTACKLCILMTGAVRAVLCTRCLGPSPVIPSEWASTTTALERPSSTASALRLRCPLPPHTSFPCTQNALCFKCLNPKMICVAKRFELFLYSCLGVPLDRGQLLLCERQYWLSAVWRWRVSLMRGPSSVGPGYLWAEAPTKRKCNCSQLRSGCSLLPAWVDRKTTGQAIVLVFVTGQIG